MRTTYDYIIVGAGAGGGPLAARLAEKHRVLLLDAGGRPHGDFYDVPAFHGHASQNPDFRWDYWVRHYPDPVQQERDSKFVTVPPKGFYGKGLFHDGRRVDGVLYPRAAGLGGCTSHHALISIYPHDDDWTSIQKLTNSPAWSPGTMRGHFDSLRRRWLPNNYRFPVASLSTDPQVLAVYVSAIAQYLKNAANQNDISRLSGLLKLAGQAGNDEFDFEPILAKFDPNVATGVANGHEGLFVVPLTTRDGKRVSTQNAIHDRNAEFGDRLVVKQRVLVTKILLQPDGERFRAHGVRVAEGAHLYEADANYDPMHFDSSATTEYIASKDVIICAGAFNTPQLLMLSGIGPKGHLEKHGIKSLIPNEGVGQNLHDRYEIAVINRFRERSRLWRECRLAPAPDDPCFQEWKAHKQGLYTISGATIAFVRKSSPDLPNADLFIFGMPLYFRGYYPNYDRDVLKTGHQQHDPRAFTWAILKKSPTGKERGSVTLRSANPSDRPLIQFNYFSGDAGDKDALALVDAIRFVRSLGEPPTVASTLYAEELQPGNELVSDRELTQWVKDEAWGHHACGTCRIGSKDGDDGYETRAVVDAEFRVHGTTNLRIVDASVFPDIPGFFIATPIHMIAEKAATDILKSG